jgi:hypothetical protein
LAASSACNAADDTSSSDGGISVDATADFGAVDISSEEAEGGPPDVGAEADQPDVDSGATGDIGAGDRDLVDDVPGVDTQSDSDAAVDAAPPSDAICTPDGWCWTNPLPVGSNMYGLWVGASDDVWISAVPLYLLHWNGRSWSGFFLPPGCPTTIGAFWGSSKDLWGIGVALDSNLLIHFDGTAWSCQSGPQDARVGWSIWGAAPNDIWAVADTELMHYDGTLWSRVAKPVDDNFYSVWGVNANDWWLGGQFGLHHFDGTTWTSKLYEKTNTGGGFFIGHISGSGSSDVWATGQAAPASDVLGVWHWNGTELSTPFRLSAYNNVGLWANGPNDVWIPPWHYDGTLYPADGGLEEPRRFDKAAQCTRSVAGTSGNDVWMVGPAICHYDGNEVSLVTTNPFAGSGITALTDAWGSSPSDLWAVGRADAFGHWDGQAWSVHGVSPPSPVLPFRIHGSTSQDVWAIGENYPDTGGLNALHWDGQTWTASRIDDGTVDGGAAGFRLNDVWAAGATDAWVMAEKTLGTLREKLLLRWNGTRWTVALRQQVDVLLGGALWGSGPTDVWALGSGVATLVHFDGVAWAPVPNTPFPNTDVTSAGDIAGTGPTDFWYAVSDKLYHYDGSVWNAVSGLRNPVSRIAATSPGELFRASMRLENFDYVPSYVGRWDGAQLVDSDVIAAFVYSPAIGDVWAFKGTEIYHHKR